MTCFSRRSSTAHMLAKLGVSGAAILAFTLPSVALADTTDYYVHLKTGNADDAGTDGDIYITLHGLGADSERTELDSSGDYNDFERGDGRWYRLSTDKTLGRIKAITLELDKDGENKNDGWQVSFAYVVGPTLEQGTPTFQQTQAWLDGKQTITGDWYRFAFNDVWLDNDDSNWTSSRTVTRKDYKETLAANVLTKPEGRWVVACSNTQKCGTSVKSSVKLGEGTDTSKTKEIGASIETSVSAGYSVPGGPSGDVSVTAGVSTALSNAISNSTSSEKGTESSCSTENVFEDRSTTVWQWEVSADLGFREKVRINTCQLACTQSDEEGRNLLGKQPPLYNDFSCSR